MGRPLYCVIARNRLTGKREIISRSLTREKAAEVRFKYTNIRGTRKHYTHTKVEIYSPQLELQFKS